MNGQKVIEGRNPVLEALLANRKIYKILIARGAERKEVISEIFRIARQREIEISEVDRKILDKISKAHQGMIAFSAEKKYASVGDILKIAEQRGEKPFIVLLDGVEDPQNLGAILRTAECAGVHGVVIPERGAVGLTPGVAKASAGAIEHLQVAIANLASTIEALKRKGIWVVGADMDAEQIYYEANLNRPVALVLGGEDRGLSRLVKQRCDFLVRIPTKGKIKSLNVSVSFALLAYEKLRQEKVFMRCER
ncbi:MAG: 23S rRNA (guanosine(2251)-2'-O)-methyltransferase RlmB [Methanobacteriota archaeon]